MPLISFFIASKKIERHIYFFFGLFSLFSAAYFVTPFLGLASLWQILFAAIYYSCFTWFIKSFTKQKKTAPQILTLILLFAFFSFAASKAELGQYLAHIGLIGMALQLVDGFKLLRQNSEKNREFLLLTIIFCTLSLEEILHLQFNLGIFGQYFSGYLPLDLFPVLFTVLIGNKLGSDLIYKPRFAIQAERLKSRENEIKLKEHDLTDFGLEIARNREFLDKLDELLKSINGHLNENSSQKIRSEIKSYLANSNSAALLQKNIKEVNREFIERLKLGFPDLSPSEIQICLLLRLQLSSKEIATIRNISSDSMKVMRYRIRKKLNLQKGDNLTSFIQAI